MLKRTLYFGNPAYLSTKLEQLVITLPERNGEVKQVPVEDIGMVILDHSQITITQGVLNKLLENNVAVITCNGKHHPTGMVLNLDGHTLQSKLFQYQIEASEPLKKQLWQNTIKAKIENQHRVLKLYGAENEFLKQLAKTVKSGDADNAEAQAAQFYWKVLFRHLEKFTRQRFGEPPNNLLNYGYAILRALVARSLVGSGMLATLGIFHRNQYNAYCLADDIMEPYRPMVDLLVVEMMETEGLPEELTPALKKRLLEIPTLDVEIDGKKSPLMVAVQRTTASLARSFEEKNNVMVYAKLLG